MMLTVIDDSNVESRLREARARSGGDRYDEVWEGISMMAPMPNHEHQVLVGRLTRVLDEIVTDQELGSVVPGVNISDRVDGWDLNYRVPDVAVFLNTTRAVNHDSFWFGGPDFAVEITSPDDRSREKLDFYGKIGTRELLIVDRESWTLELYRLKRKSLALVAAAVAGDGAVLASKVLRMELSIVQATARPRILVRETRAGKTWTI